MRAEIEQGVEYGHREHATSGVVVEPGHDDPCPPTVDDAPGDPARGLAKLHHQR